MDSQTVQDLNHVLQRTKVFGDAWTAEEKIGQGRYGGVFRISRITGSLRETAALKWIRVSANDPRLDDEGIQQYYERLKSDCRNELENMIRFKGKSHIVQYDNYMIEENEAKKSFDILLQMELLQPLKDYFSSREIRVLDVLELGAQIAQACGHLHQNGIVHGDIKPENLFVAEADGELSFKLGDFGISATPNEWKRNGVLRGTLHYMPPELLDNGIMSFSCDQYSLGVVLYDLLNSSVEVYNDERRELPALGGEELGRVVLRMCAKDPNERYESILKARDDLATLLLKNRNTYNTENVNGLMFGKEGETQTAEERILTARLAYKEKQKEADDLVPDMEYEEHCENRTEKKGAVVDRILNYSKAKMRRERESTQKKKKRIARIAVLSVVLISVTICSLLIIRLIDSGALYRRRANGMNEKAYITLYRYDPVKYSLYIDEDTSFGGFLRIQGNAVMLGSDLFLCDYPPPENGYMLLVGFSDGGIEEHIGDKSSIKVILRTESSGKYTLSLSVGEAGVSVENYIFCLIDTLFDQIPEKAFGNEYQMDLLIDGKYVASVEGRL